MTALPCNLPHIVRQFIVGSRRPCAFGYTEFCGGRISVKAQLIKEGFPSAGHPRIARIRWTIPQVNSVCAVSVPVGGAHEDTFKGYGT
jgi:hypothetical protein